MDKNRNLKDYIQNFNNDKRKNILNRLVDIKKMKIKNFKRKQQLELLESTNNKNAQKPNFDIDSEIAFTPKLTITQVTGNNPNITRLSVTSI